MYNVFTSIYNGREQRTIYMQNKYYKNAVSKWKWQTRANILNHVTKMSEGWDTLVWILADVW